MILRRNYGSTLLIYIRIVIRVLRVVVRSVKLEEGEEEKAASTRQLV